MSHSIMSRNRASLSRRNITVGMLAVLAILLGILTTHAMAASAMSMDAPPPSGATELVVTNTVPTIHDHATPSAVNIPPDAQPSPLVLVCIIGLSAIVALLLLAFPPTLRLDPGGSSPRVNASTRKSSYVETPALQMLSVIRI